MALDDMIQHEPSDEDVAALYRSVAAGAQGDVEASLRHECSGAIVLESPHRFLVRDLLVGGDAVPAWAYSRWCVDLAARRMLLEEDPRTTDAVRIGMVLLHPENLARVRDDSGSLGMFGTQVAAGDSFVMDIALYEMGGLRDFIDQYARPGLLGKTDRVREWADARMGAYAFVDLRGCRLVLRDLRDESEVEVLNIGAMSLAQHDHLVGRVVPISAEPGLMFAARPVSVDALTATEVADALDGDPLDWCFALAEALAADRLLEGFHCTGVTPFISDLPFPELVYDEATGDVRVRDQGEDAPRTAELRAKGYREDVANALGVLEIGLIAAGICDGATSGVVPDVAMAMDTPGVFEAAQVECSGPDTAEAWSLLAAMVPEHVSERCRVLARCARAAQDPPSGAAS